MIRDPLVGKILADTYEIVDRIGEGGMGVVYKARQISVDRIVAIKILNAQVAQDPQWVGRFINEAKACSKLQHPNTVRLFDFRQTREGLLFMAMEFLDGMSIRTAIDRYGRMQPARVLRIISQCCQSLAEAHNLGIIHRDIKPDNLFLVTVGGQQDYVKVLDFSVAKLKQASGSAMQTQAGVVFGTPNYMSPEQGRGLPLDARSDIYALGIVAYEMLTGRPPFSSQNPMEVLAMHVRTPVPPLVGLPERVGQIVMRALNKDPAHRQQNAEQLYNECQSTLMEMGIAPSMSGSVPVQHQHQHQHQQPQAARTILQSGQGMGGPPPQMGGGGHDPARTVIAMQGSQMPPTMLANPIGQHGMPMPPQQMPAHTPTTPQGGAQARTVFMGESGGAAPVGVGGRQSAQLAARRAKKKKQADALFWALCIIAGVLIGVIAYVIVAKVTH